MLETLRERPVDCRLLATTLVALLCVSNMHAQTKTPPVPTKEQENLLQEVTAKELEVLPKPEWDVIGKRPGYTKTQPLCIDYLKFSVWMKPMFADAPVKVAQTYWTVSRNFVSADFQGESDRRLVALKDSDVERFRQHLRWGVLQVDERSINTERGVADLFVARALGYAVASSAAGAYDVLALIRAVVTDASEKGQRALYLGLDEKVVSGAHAYRSLVRISHEGRLYVRERYGLVSPKGEAWVYTCYWPQTGVVPEIDATGRPRFP